jgi:hypothetical protein
MILLRVVGTDKVQAIEARIARIREEGIIVYSRV